MLKVIQMQQEEIGRLRDTNQGRAVEVARTFGDAVGVFEERIMDLEGNILQELKLLRSRGGNSGGGKREEEGRGGLEDRVKRMEDKIDRLIGVMGGGRNV